MSYISRTQSYIETIPIKIKIIMVLGISMIAILTLFAPKNIEISDRKIADISFVLGSQGGSEEALIASGVVEQSEDITLNAKTSGTLISFPYSPGDSIYQGAVIAVLEHDLQSADVISAKGILLQREAELLKLQNGTRQENLDVLEQQTISASLSLENAKKKAEIALLSAYSTVDSAYPGGVDVLFENIQSSNPILVLSTSNSGLAQTVIQERLNVKDILIRQTTPTDERNNTLEEELVMTLAELQSIKLSLDNILILLNNALPSSAVSKTTIDAHISMASARRTGIISSIEALTEATNLLKSTNSALEIAKSNKSEGVTGSRNEDLAAAEAAVINAQGALKRAEAELNNAYVRAPFAGHVLETYVDNGDTISKGEPLARLGATGGWNILGETSDAYAAYITEGQLVKISFRGAELFEAPITRVVPVLKRNTNVLQFEIYVDTIPDFIQSGATVSIIIPRTKESAKYTQTETFVVPNTYIGYGYDGAYVMLDKEKIPIRIKGRNVTHSIIEHDGQLHSGVTITNPLLP